MPKSNQGPGRPKEFKRLHRVTITLEPAQLKALERYKSRKKLASRSDAVRHLINKFIK